MKVDDLRTALRHEAMTELVRTEESVASVMRRVHRRRRRQRALLGGAGIVAVALVGSVIALVNRDDADDRFVTTSPSSSLVLAILTTRPVNAAAGQYASEVVFVDPTTGTSHGQPVPDNNYGEYPVQLFQIGDRLLLPGGGGVRSAPIDLSSPPRDIAPALVFVPSSHRDRVWTVSKWQRGNTGPYTVTEIAADGTPTTGPLALPEEAYWPIVGTDRGLLLYAPGDEVLLWDPDTGEVTRRIAGVQWFQGNGWGAGNLFAWVGPCSGQPPCDTLHLLDLTTGDERTVEPPAGVTAFVPDGALSPDGQTLALFATTENPGRQLVLVSTSTGDARPVVGSSSGGSGVAWAPDGTSVFFGEHGSTAISSYHLGDSSSHRVRDGLPQFTTILAVERKDAGTGVIEGTLTAVGGRAPGDPKPTAGVMTLQRDGQEVQRVEIPASGIFRLEVPPGAYDVTATFGNELPCGEKEVSVQPGEVSKVSFTCQMR